MLLLNGKNVVKGRFPNNEINYLAFDENNKPGIMFDGWHFTLIFESNEDLFNLLVYKKAIDDSPYYAKARTILKIKFFPYEQMDREMPGHLFSLKYVAQIINDCNFDKVIVYDPHSNVLPASLKKCTCLYPVTEKGAFRKSDVLVDRQLIDYDLAFYPDNGAAKKYSEVLPNMKYRFGNKKRNLDTGDIIKYEVIADKEEIEGKEIIIIDDLVMGGRTFKEAAKALREMGAKRVDLYVTHLMPQARQFYNSNGDGLIDNIYSADTLDLIETFETPELRP